MPGALAAAALAVVSSALLLLGAKKGWILCWTNCGETFDALLYVENFKLYGLQYKLVQDMATAPSLEAHPFLYTHNPNLAGYLFVLLEALGIHSLQRKQLITTAVFIGGLAYAYVAVRSLAKSQLLAVTTLLLLATDLTHVLSYGLNPLRAWHWVALFGTAYHVNRIAESGFTWRQALCVLVFATVALGIGYDFWIICLTLAALLIAIPTAPTAPINLRRLGPIVGLFAVPFLLRQWQVASVIGPQLWWWDLITSAAIKVPSLSRVISLPSSAAIDEQYIALNILRPPASPETFSGALDTFFDMLREILLPEYGAITLLAVLFLGLVAVVMLVLRRSLLEIEGPPSGTSVLDAYPTARLLAVLLGAAVLGLIVFAPLSFHIYIKHGFPLLAAPFHLAKAVLFTLAVRSIRSAGSTERFSRRAIAGAIGFTCLAIDTAIVDVRNVEAMEPISVAWIDEIEHRGGDSFAVSWIPNSVSVFTHEWAIGIAPGRERSIAARMKNSGHGFQRDDLFLFGERDRDTQNYLTPSFWLYYPTDQNVQFDSPSPKCRKDWIIELASPLLIAGSRNAQLELRGLLAEPRANAVAVQVWGRSSPGLVLDGDTMHLESATANNVVSEAGPVLFNCIYRTFEGQLHIPKAVYERRDVLRVVMVRNGRRIATSAVFSAAMPVGHLPELRYPQPSPSRLIRIFPQLPVAKLSEEYVIFDLRKVH
jgi:hypothetical protein